MINISFNLNTVNSGTPSTNNTKGAIITDPTNKVPQAILWAHKLRVEFAPQTLANA